jgi:hypothetical protein
MNYLKLFATTTVSMRTQQRKRGNALVKFPMVASMCDVFEHQLYHAWASQVFASEGLSVAT